VSTPSSSTHAIRFRGRSFLAFTLTPVPPISDWLAELDQWIANSPGFFAGKAVVLDLAGVNLSESAIGHLVKELGDRDVRIMGIEGADPGALGPQLPPVLMGGRSSAEEKPASTEPAPQVQPAAAPETAAPAVPPETAAAAALPPRREPASLLIDSPIRSGQSVIFPHGDVTVLGSVASGAEVVAGGSIHIYGALRGRALAGSMGDGRARIFCRKNEAELIAIDGYYRTAEDTATELRGRAVQVRLEGAGLTIAALE
jgi:septum site-determining protein MinC